MTTSSFIFQEALKGRFNPMKRAFSAHEGLHDRIPWALPTAVMNHAVGVKEGTSQPAAGLSPRHLGHFQGLEE